MGRLKAPPPLVARLSSLLPEAPPDQPDAIRSRTQHWRNWYKLKRWQDLATRVFIRDLYTCQHTRKLLTHKAPHPLSPVAHHKVPHRGDPALFWDENNIETVSKEWHDGEGRRADQLH